MMHPPIRIKSRAEPSMRLSAGRCPISAVKRSSEPAVNDSAGGCCTDAERAALVEDLPRAMSRARRARTAASTSRRADAQVVHDELGNQSGSTGSTNSSSGATGYEPEEHWTISGKALAFQSCGVLARGYAPGTGRLAARVAADALRDAMSGIQLRQVEQRAREIQRPRVEAKPAQPEDDRRLLDGPDGAAVIAQRVVDAVRPTRASGCPSR